MTGKTKGFSKPSGRSPVPHIGSIKAKKLSSTAYRVIARSVRKRARAEVVEIPVDEYVMLRSRLEDLEDSRDLAATAKNAKPGDYLSAAMMDRILDGEHPVRVWREHRGLSARALAGLAGMPVSYLSEIENRKKPGSIDAYRALAEALDLAIDDIAP